MPALRTRGPPMDSVAAAAADAAAGAAIEGAGFFRSGGGARPFLRVLRNHLTPLLLAPAFLTPCMKRVDGPHGGRLQR